MTDRDIAHSVGFIDGEGCVLLGKDKRVCVEVEQVDPAPLYQLQALWGGAIIYRKSRNVWRWRITPGNGRLKNLLVCMTECWSTKAQQARTLRGYMAGNVSFDNARRLISALKHNRPHKREEDNGAA